MSLRPDRSSSNKPNKGNNLPSPGGTAGFLHNVSPQATKGADMKRSPNPWIRAVWTALFVALVAMSAMAQTPTGSIFGTVAGNDNATLPGVTVTLTGPGAAQTAVTDSQGRFR